MSRSVIPPRAAALAARMLADRPPGSRLLLLISSWRDWRRGAGATRWLPARIPTYMDPETAEKVPGHGVRPDTDPHGAALQRYQPGRGEKALQPLSRGV